MPSHSSSFHDSSYAATRGRFHIIYMDMCCRKLYLL
jgi:hypothetical protein